MRLAVAIWLSTPTGCSALLSHSTKVLRYSVEEDDKAELDRATTATNTGSCLLLMSEYRGAEQTECSAVMAREEVLGREHPHTLISVSQRYGARGGWMVDANWHSTLEQVPSQASPGGKP
jgi:hypothetical protein